MALLQTTPIPLLAIIFFAVLVILILFLVKVFFSDRLLRKTLKEKPIILVVGPPNTGKKEILERLTTVKVKTKTYPFIGRFRVCDVSLKAKTDRCLCFHCMKDDGTLNRNNIKLLDRKPALILFIVRILSDLQKIEKQGHVFKELKKKFAGTPAIAVMNKTDARGKVKIKDIRRVFGKDLLGIPADKSSGLAELRNAIEKLT